MHMKPSRCIALGALLACGTSSLMAQARPDSTFSDLRRDGNGIAALQTIVSIGFSDIPAGQALRDVATAARLNLTFDPQIPGLSSKVSIAAHDRTTAAALLEIATPAHLRVRVSPTGQVIVLPEARMTVDRAVAATDTAHREAVNLPVVRTEAARVERQSFTTRTSVGDIAITGRELRASPTFVEPDLMRSVQLLPGVESRSDWAAGFNVRGGEADQSLVLLDGYPIYNPYHLGGVFSTFIDATVGDVQLHKGALAPRYGGRLSGVLDVRSAEPTSDDKQRTVEVSLVSTSASIGDTFADGKGSWMVAARRTYADAVTSLLIQPGVFPYHFRDIQAHVTRKLGSDTRLSVTAYDGVDVVAGSNSDERGGTWGNSVLGATLSKRLIDHPHFAGLSLGDSVILEQRASLSHFGVHVDVSEDLFRVHHTLTETRLSGSAASHHNTTVRTLGYEIADQRLAYRAAAAFNGFGDVIPLDSLGQRSRWAAVFAEQLWHPSASLLVDAGVRLETVPTANWSGVSPRLSLKYFLGTNAALTAGAGSYSQWMHSMGREEEPVEPLQFWVASDSLTPVSRARDATVGLERWVSPRRLFHIEAFYKWYDHLLVANSFNDPRTKGDEFNVAHGTSYGVDVLLRQLDGGRFSGWLAYSYALSSRVRDDGTGYFPTQDRRHNLNLVGSWRLRSYTLGARANFASGLPTTPVVGGFLRGRYDPVTHAWIPEIGSSGEQNIAGAYNSLRLPWYARIDVSVKKSGRLFGGRAEPYLSILNVMNAHNPAAYLYSFTGRTERTSFPNLPFAPTFGLSLAY